MLKYFRKCYFFLTVDIYYLIEIKHQRSLTVSLNLHKKLKSNEDEQLHYSDSEKRDESHTIVELGSNTLETTTI